MIEQDALVVTVEGELAEVETQRQSACGDCSARSGCGTSLLAEVFGKRRSRLWVSNPIQARVGERVVIGLQERPFLRAAINLYATPLLAMMGGALIGEWLAERSSSSVELGALVGGLSGLLAGFMWLRRFARSSRNDREYRPVVLRRNGGGVMVQPPRASI